MAHAYVEKIAIDKPFALHYYFILLFFELFHHVRLVNQSKLVSGILMVKVEAEKLNRVC